MSPIEKHKIKWQRLSIVLNFENKPYWKLFIKANRLLIESSNFLHHSYLGWIFCKVSDVNPLFESAFLMARMGINAPNFPQQPYASTFFNNTGQEVRYEFYQ